jgi:concanavalin A-like lectin/glucanase superfamily protein
VRWMGLVSTAAAVVVLASVPSGAGIDGRPGPADRPAGTVPVAEAPDAVTAAAAARAQGTRVEALDLRTETRVVYAEPDGTMTAELTTRPVRAQRDGQWVDVDTALARGPGGSVSPVATTVDLSFSGGGTDQPLVRYGRDGAWIELRWPGRLPAPVLAADTATYPEVLPGVDLQLRAEVDGFSQYLVVKDRTAAEQPAVRRIALGLRTEGVALTSTPEGALAARDGEGTVLFAAPVSQMWDSGDPQRRAQVGATVDGDTLVLRPDRAMLADPATRYPVIVDPIWHTADKHSWTSVLSGHPGTPFPNSSGQPPLAQVGYCWTGWSDCNGIGVARTYWMFDTSFLAGKLLIEAYLNADVVHSPDCNTTARHHQVWYAHRDIDGGTAWNNMPPGTHIGDWVAPKVNVEWGCPGNKTAALNVGTWINMGGTTTYFVMAASEAATAQSPWWRKYDNNAKLRVRFNTVPNVPTELSTDPPMAAPCRWCGGIRYFGEQSVRLRARLSDPDPGDWTEAHWSVKVNGVAQPEVEGPGKPSGELHDHLLNLANQHDKTFEWAVKAEDGFHGGGWAVAPSFVTDQRPPTVAPTVTGVLYQQDNQWHGGIGVPGTFHFESAGVADIDHFLYTWNDGAPRIKVDADRLGGRATVLIAPPSDGPQQLQVVSVDRAGHRSPMQTFHTHVRAGNGPLAQWEFEGNATDEAFLGERDGTIHGTVAYVPGAVGQAIRFDGAGAHVTAPNALRTDASFSVATWVRLDQPPPSPHAFTALSQDGAAVSGFFLGYRQQDTGGFWEFTMPSADSATNPGGAGVRSSQPAQLGVWTHLTAAYDAPARQLRLYVNGSLAGSAPIAAAFHATGAVAIGRALNGVPTNHWRGLVDEVKLYDRLLTAAEIRAGVGADDVQASHWRFDELAGTTARNQVDGAEMAILQDGATFTGDSDGDQLADGGAVGGAVVLDGQADQVIASRPAVHTNQSYSVAAWVRLDRAPAAPNTFTALSQDGANISGFFLGYRQLEIGGRWELFAPSADVAGGGTAPAAVRSSQPAQLGVWTHLAAVYDAGAGQLRLYVNGAQAGTAGFAGGFDATGPFVIGRGRNGVPGGYWPGAVDEVRAYSRELSEAEVQMIVSRNAVALGSWRLDGNPDDASGNDRHGTLSGNPDWTTGQTDAPDPTDLAVRLDGNDHISVPHTVDVRQSFSVAAWARVDRIGGTATLLSQDGNQISSFQLMVTPEGRWSLAMPASDTASGGTVDRANGPTAQPGVWTHVVASYDASARQLILYVNGVLAGTAAHTQGWDRADGGLQIGAGLVGANRQNRFFGTVDDVAVYGRVLFAEEIRTMAGRDLTLAHNWRLDEGSGTNAADAVGRHAATLAGGATRVPGRIGNAVKLDGVDDRATTAAVDIRTDASFTVATWVHLTRTCDPGAEFSCTLTAVSLDGGGSAQASKFQLGHTVDRGQNPDGVWVFEMREPGGTITKAAVTILPSDLGSWVHLAGVYDRPTGTLVLYVNGTRKGDGRLSEPWHATGGLQIGRGRDAAGNPAGYFPGVVDDVRLYSGALDDGRISNLYGSYPAEQGEVTLPTAGAGRWRFDENTGTVAADSSGNGRSATLLGGAGWVPGRSGHAGMFDGVDDYAQTAMPVLDTTRDFSLSAWAYLGNNSSQGDNLVVLGQDGQAVSGFYLYFDRASRRWALAMPTSDAANPALAGVLSSEPAQAGRWTQLGLVYRADLDQLRFYVNGRLAAARTGVPTWPSPASGPLTIGRGRWNGANRFFFQGAIDDVRAFGEALTDAEMGMVYDDTRPVEVGNWRFDDNTLRDWSSRNNPTTATGQVSYVDGPAGRALSLNGSAAATTQSWGVPTQGSFTVSAWARLASKSTVQTVVAQDGTRMSGFVLQYRPTLDRWVFGAWTGDRDDAELVLASAGAPAVAGEWTRLTGVYDHVAGELRLYVNGQLAGSQDGVTLWPATGGLTIGRGLQNGAPAQFFTGAVDEVRTQLGIVPDSEI